MTNHSPELQEVLNLLQKKEKLVAMLAPSFPVDFPYPEIAGKLKRTGFDKVVEVATGAYETNRQTLLLLLKNPHKRYITSPCPSIVRLIKTKYPHLRQFVAQASSPMVNTAILTKEIYPKHRPVFVGPCLTKKLEAKEYPHLKIIVLTFKELFQIFDLLNIKDNPKDSSAKFDLVKGHTRLYPLSGGLAESAEINELLSEGEYEVISGLKESEEALSRFEKNQNIRLLDILFCPGGCVSGPGIHSQVPLEKRREPIIRHWAKYCSRIHNYK